MKKSMISIIMHAAHTSTNIFCVEGCTFDRLTKLLLYQTLMLLLTSSMSHFGHIEGIGGPCCVGVEGLPPVCRGGTGGLGSDSVTLPSVGGGSLPSAIAWSSCVN